jgi:hypothetical protein
VSVFANTLDIFVVDTERFEIFLERGVRAIAVNEKLRTMTARYDRLAKPSKISDTLQLQAC